MSVNRKILMPLIALCLVVSEVVAQDVKVGGQVRPRWEFRDPYSATASGGDWFVSMRARADITAALEKNVTVFVQLQDVRLWGEEANTLGDFSADNLDLHQAYVEVKKQGDTNLAARAGRQQVAFGGQRLVGAVNWTQQGRSFDAVKLSAGDERLHLDILGAVLANDLTATFDADAHLLGAYGQVKEVGPGTLEAYGLYNKVAAVAPTSQMTLGARWFGASDKIDFRVEGSYQIGQRMDNDVSAFMLGGRVGTKLNDGKASVALWYDYLSGDDDPADDQIKVFDTLYATNHKFYGLADYFLNIPVHTAGRGLQDIALKGSIVAADAVTFRMEAHSFHAAQSEGLSTGHFGEEFDVTAAYRYTSNLGFSAGVSYVMAADGFADIGRLTENVFWTHIMMDASF